MPCTDSQYTATLISVFMEVYRDIQRYAEIYRGVRGYAEIYRGIQGCRAHSKSGFFGNAS